MFDIFKKMRKEEAEYFAEEGEVKMLKAKDAMISPVLLYSDDECATIIKKLKREDTNVCIVIDKDKKFVGEISDNDLIKLFLQQVKYEPLVQTLNIGYRREFLYKSAKEMINKHKATVKADTPINKVIELIYKDGFNYIPVLDDKKRVIGVITPSSVIELLKED